MRFKKLFPLVFSLVIISACALPTALTSATPMVSTVAASGTVLFNDDFASALSGWDQAANAVGRAGYNGGVYRMLVDAPNSLIWSTPAAQFDDVRIEVDTAAIAGPASSFAGIACRVSEYVAGDKTLYQFYSFIISSDGYFAIGLTQDGKFTLLGQDQMAPSANINIGLALNHLRADCAGSTLTFYINGFLVGQVNDPTLTSGEVGLLSGTLEQGGADIVFDKFIVLQP